jgi:hypothetical protein
VPWVDPFEWAGPETGPEQNDTLTADELGRLSVDLMARADEEPSEDHRVKLMNPTRSQWRAICHIVGVLSRHGPSI